MADALAASFDRAAEEYERGRPGWPAQALESVAGDLGLAPSATVLDLAAGTGKLTRLLSARFDRVLAVEPLEGMRSLLGALVPGVEALAGTAESIPLADDSVDAVFVGEAFHWFDGARALAEIARVLRPGGGLVLLWNEPVGPFEPRFPPELAARINELRATRKTAEQRHETGSWRAAFEAVRFEPLREARVEHEQVVDRQGVVAQIASMSFVASLPDGDREALLAEVRGALEEPQYRRRYVTELHWTRLAD